MLNYKYLETAGRKRPVVFLHGFLESIKMWEELDLHQDYSCLWIDLPGHGRSDLGEELTMKSMAEQVLEVIRKEGVEEYDIIGHSMGGYVALEVKELDANCMRLVLLNSNYWSDSDSKKVDRQRVAELVQTKKEMFVREAIPNLFRNPNKYSEKVNDLIADATEMSVRAVADSSIAMSQRKDFTLDVKKWGEDVVAVQGEFDTIVPLELMQRKSELSEVQYHVLPTGHMAHIEQTEELNVVLRELLK